MGFMNENTGPFYHTAKDSIYLYQAIGSKFPSTVNVTVVTNFLNTFLGCCDALHCFYIRCIFFILFQTDIKLINISFTHTHVRAQACMRTQVRQNLRRVPSLPPELIWNLCLLYVCSQNANFLISAHSG